MHADPDDLGRGNIINLVTENTYIMLLELMVQFRITMLDTFWGIFLTILNNK